MKSYFSKEELTCKCGCGMANFSIKLLEIMNHVRNNFGKPIIVSSACRCPEHNKEVGGVSDSAHVSTDIYPCEAMDIKCYDSSNRYNLMHLFKSYGISRFGIARGFIHIDIDMTKPSGVIWLYK